MDWLQGIILGVVVIAGAILIRGPIPNSSLEIFSDFANRYFGRQQLELNFHPAHGALLLARLAAIAPLCITTGLLIGERRLNVSLNILDVMGRVLAATMLFACVCGAAATWLNQRKLRRPLATWVAIWIVPEIVRLVAPDSPTCRSIFGWLLATVVGPWGPS